jgi:hypothetical protein
VDNNFVYALLVVAGLLLLFGGGRWLAYFFLKRAVKKVERSLTLAEVSETGPQGREVYADAKILWQRPYAARHSTDDKEHWMAYGTATCSETPVSMDDIKLVRLGAGFRLYGHPTIPDESWVSYQ